MSNIFSTTNILIYLLIINLITFLVMYIDKRRAKWGKWRIKESTLFTFVLIGGSIGGILGMKILRHKTKKPMFKIGFPMILIIQIICVICISL